MRHIPSAKTLENAFSDVLSKGRIPVDEALRELRALLVAWRDGALRYESTITKPSRYMLEEANRILDGHGIEFLESENGKAAAYYVNMGDTYAPTLLLDTARSRVWATTWGDWVEAEERRGNKFD